MRQRFTEINIKGQAGSIPVGCQASNVTLSDGTILQEALGNIDYQKKGSLVDQLETMRIANGGEFAPLQNPHFKNGIMVRRYSTNDNLLTQVQPYNYDEAVRGISSTYSSSENTWYFEGAIEAGTEDNNLYVLYGSADSASFQIVGPGTYFAKAEHNGVLIQDNIKLQFFWHNSQTEQNYESFIEENTQNSSITFTIDTNQYLSRISLFIELGTSNIIFTDKTLKITLKKVGDIPVDDTYNSVFDVQKLKSNSAWQTTISENLIVEKGMQEEAKSTLGTIYNSKWGGKLEVKEIENTNGQDSGIIVPNGAISFPLTDNLSAYTGATAKNQRDNFINKTINIRNKGYYIGSDYNWDTATGNLAYVAPEHRFWTSSNTSCVDITTDKTLINNLLVANKVQSTMLTPFFMLNNKKDLEQIVRNEKGIVIPNYQVITFATSAKMGGFLINGEPPAKDNDGAICYGFGYKIFSTTGVQGRTFRGIFMAANLYKFEYFWQANPATSRTLKIWQLTTGAGGAATKSTPNIPGPGSDGW